MRRVDARIASGGDGAGGLGGIRSGRGAVVGGVGGLHRQNATLVIIFSLQGGKGTA